MNEQDPLAQLRDIHSPDPVGLWPPAPGWWLLAAVLLGLLIWWGYRSWRRYRANAYRRAAQQELQQLWQDYQASGDALAYATALNQLLRRTARTAVPRQAATINQRHGRAWLEWLDQSLASHHHPHAFRDGPGRWLVELPYRPVQQTPDLAPLQQLASHWLQHHGPAAPAATDAATDPQPAPTQRSHHASV